MAAFGSSPTRGGPLSVQDFYPGLSVAVATQGGQQYGIVHSVQGGGGSEGFVRVRFAAPTCIRLLKPTQMRPLESEVHPDDVCAERIVRMLGATSLGIVTSPTLIITNVSDPGPARTAGLQPGRRIIAINRREVSTQPEAMQAMYSLGEAELAEGFPILLSQVLVEPGADGTVSLPQGDEPGTVGAYSEAMEEQVEDLQEALTQTRLMLRDVHGRLVAVTQERNAAVERADRAASSAAPPQRQQRQGPRTPRSKLEQALGNLLLDHMEENPPKPRRHNETRRRRHREVADAVEAGAVAPPPHDFIPLPTAVGGGGAVEAPHRHSRPAARQRYREGHPGGADPGGGGGGGFGNMEDNARALIRLLDGRSRGGGGGGVGYPVVPPAVPRHVPVSSRLPQEQVVAGRELAVSAQRLHTDPLYLGLVAATEESPPHLPHGSDGRRVYRESLI